MTHLISAGSREAETHHRVTHRATRLIQLGFLIVSLSLHGCNRLAQSEFGRTILRGTGQVASVESIHDQDIAIDRVVYLTGTVGDRIPILDGQIYQLQDETGSIWVVTDQQTLQTGDRLAIRGAVRFQDFPEIEGASGEFYIQELKQIERTAAGE